MDWGHPANLQHLWNHVTAAQYQQAAAYSLANLWESFALFFSLLLENWWWVGVLFIILGTIQGIKYHFNRTVFALILLVSNIILTAFYRIPDINPYYLPGLLACMVLISNAIFWLFDKFPRRGEHRSLLVIAGGAVILLLLLHHRHMDRSANRLADNYGKLILDSAGSGTVFTYDDNASFAAMYLRYAELYQPGVEVYDRAARLKALCDRSSLLTGQPVTDYSTARAGFIQKAPGQKHLVKCLFPYDADWYSFELPYYSNGILYSFSTPRTKSVIRDFKLTDDYFDFKSRQICINVELCRGQEFLQKASRDTNRALEAFRKALKILENEPRGALHNQLGISFRHLGVGDLALVSYERALKSSRLTESERKEVIFNISNIYKDRGNQSAAAGNIQGALDAFMKALEFDPENPKVLYNIGVIYCNYLKMPQKGIPYLEAYLKVNPMDKKTRELLNSQRKER